MLVLHDVELLHLTARALPGRRPFEVWDTCATTWHRLRKAFPEALACSLMPNHPHLITADPDPARAVRRFKGVLSSVESVWHRGPAAKLLSQRELVGELRYVWLNALRAGLVDDTLRWEWCSFRELVGAVIDPWIPVDRVLTATGLSFGRLWRTATTDRCLPPSAAVLPRPPLASIGASLASIAAAARAATRSSDRPLTERGPTQRLFGHLARECGWDRAQLVASICDVTPRTVRNWWASPNAPDLTAAKLCLGDERLRQTIALASPERAQARRG